MLCRFDCEDFCHLYCMRLGQARISARRGILFYVSAITGAASCLEEDVRGGATTVCVAPARRAQDGGRPCQGSKGATGCLHSIQTYWREFLVIRIVLFATIEARSNVQTPPLPLSAQAPEDAPPATFALAILTPEEVDVVDLVANTRTLWRRSGSQGWESTAVNP